MKTIYLDITGQCGNQLFQYAFAKKIANINAPVSKIKVNFSLVKQYSNVCGSGFFYEDNLQYFRIDDYENITLDDKGTCIHKFGSEKQNSILEKYYSFIVPLAKKTKLKIIARWWNKKMQKYGIYREDEFFRFKKKIKSKENNIFIRGYFEEPTFYTEKDYLNFCNFFTPVCIKDGNLTNIIKTFETVCVSVRVWSEKYLSEKQVEVRNIVGKDYYQKAVDLAYKMHPQAIFIVFSNDTDWVKRNIIFPASVEYESGKDDIANKLFLMRSCNHFVIGNSTFSWWAQQLQTSKNKTVIAPKIWYSNPKMITHLFMPDWIRIDNSKSLGKADKNG